MRSRPLVLVVDDDSSMLRAVERLLTVRGYAVETFDNAASFVAGMPGSLVTGLSWRGSCRRNGQTYALTRASFRCLPVWSD